MKVQITKYEPFAGNSKTFKGKFSFEFQISEATEAGKIRVIKGEVRDCSLFDNGNAKWIVYPDKRIKNEETGNWEHSYSYFAFLEPKDEITAEILFYLNEHLSKKG